jgi:hypothetical protein
MATTTEQRMAHSVAQFIDQGGIDLLIDRHQDSVPYGALDRDTTRKLLNVQARKNFGEMVISDVVDTSTLYLKCVEMGAFYVCELSSVVRTKRSSLLT